MRGDVKMEEIFKARIEELNLDENEREFMLKNIEICSKIYARGIRDIELIIEKININI